ncbi:MAG: spermidine synthase [Hyphomicrobiales bacterium]
MASIELSRSPRTLGSPLPTATLWVFASSLFLSALLLFSAEPMFTKMVLPRLGGSPGVWSVAMVFFQAILLLGYVYAHLLMRHLPLRLAVAVHAAVLATAFTAMPIAVSQGFGHPPVDGAPIWLIGLFGASVGLPLFAVSANGPLLQSWFARSGHSHADDPYFLYAASNLGSFAALLAYPLILEPSLALREQSLAWTGGYVALAAAIALCAGLALSFAPPNRIAAPQAAIEPADEAPSWRDRCAWCVFAFIPSALLVAVTVHISTDIASAPFLWVLPLALFLLTFVLVFKEQPLIPHAALLRIQPAVIAILACLFAISTRLNVFVAAAIDLGGFFVLVMICHGELYRRRPSAAHLTGFYVWMSFGGVLGGGFAALLAPHLFVTVFEYPLLIVATLLARPALLSQPPHIWASEGLPVVLAGFLLLVPGLVLHIDIPPRAEISLGAVTALFACLAMLQHARPVRLLALTVLLLALTQAYQPGSGQSVFARSFFGVMKAMPYGEGGRFRALIHGTTIHGAERILDDDGRPVSGPLEPLTYYYPGGPLAEAIAAARGAKGRLPRVAIIGLGVGTLACYRHEGEDWRFFEIDPEVVRLATDASLFHYLSSCAPDAAIRLGDARLTIAEERPGYDLVVIDAFSSDAVPAHLLTKEAVALYVTKLAPDGALIFNISNRNIELGSVLAASAEANGLVMLWKRDQSPVDTERTMHSQAEVAVLARQPQDTGIAPTAAGWASASSAGTRVWSDDYSDLVGAIWRRYRQ